MTILFLISSEGHYGIENMLVILARKLSQLGCNSIVGVFQDSRFPHTEVAEEARNMGLTVELVRCSGRVDWNAVAQIRKLLMKHGVDVLHPHGYKADLYAYAAASMTSVALLATSHNWPNKLLSMRAYAALDRLVLRRFDKVAVVSSLVKDRLQRSGIAPDKLVMISNGVDLDRFHTAENTSKQACLPDHARVGFVGRLVPDKGGAHFLRAAQQILATHPNTQFVLVGEGPCRRDWEALAVQLRIAQHVVFTGVCNNMPVIYASLDMLVLPSLVESMPMCVLEAMAASKPVIATRVGDVPKVILSEQTGLLIEPGDINRLAQAMARLINDPDLARRLGANGRAHVQQHFSAEAMAESYFRQYEGVLAHRAIGDVASLAASQR